jgi:hypothetical protein
MLKIAAQKEYFTAIFQHLSVHNQHLTALVCTAAWHDFQISLEHSTGQLGDQMSSMESSLYQTLSQRAASNNLLQHKLSATLYSASVVENATSTTARQLGRMDEKLTQLQLLVKASIDTTHNVSGSSTKTPKQRRKPRARLYASTRQLELVGYDKQPKKGSDTKGSCQYTMNLADTDVWVRERHGKRTYQLVADPDLDFTTVLGTEKADGAISAVSTPPAVAFEEGQLSGNRQPQNYTESLFSSGKGSFCALTGRLFRLVPLH